MTSKTERDELRRLWEGRNQFPVNIKFARAARKHLPALLDDLDAAEGRLALMIKKGGWRIARREGRSHE